MTGTAVSGDVTYYNPASGFKGMVSDRELASEVVKFNAFAPCENESFDTDAAPGDSVTSCSIAVTEKGKKVTGALFGPSGGDYSYIAGDPVVWK